MFDPEFSIHFHSIHFHSEGGAGLLEFVSAGFVSLWLGMAGYTPRLGWTQFLPLSEVPWQTELEAADPSAAALLQTYLKIWNSQGNETPAQGVWLQTGTQFLATNQGTVPLPAASLTKIATSFAALQTWGVDQQFETVILATGPIQNGVLDGDLVIRGGGDPALVLEEAIALGNALNQLGIRRVTGGLAIAGHFWLDFQADAKTSGEDFKAVLNAKTWSRTVESVFQQLPPGTRRPQVEIVGPVAVVAANAIPADLPVLLRHPSLPLLRLLKLMNTHSSNFLAQAIATELGGAATIMQAAVEGAGIQPAEIQLQNGSGLGPQNQLSPRAVCALFAAIQHYLQPRHLNLGDVFPVAGTDVGTLADRTLPPGAVVKTGTLRDVSALAGVVPTRDRGPVWFAILNRGDNIQTLRQQQERFLQDLTHQWGQAEASPTIARPSANPTDPWPRGERQAELARDRRIEAAVDFNSQQQ